MTVVRAAGAVLWRRGDRDASDAGDRGQGDHHTVEVALVHRPRYDDWTLPKGKLEAGEDEPAAALREVAEETGHGGALGMELGRVDYLVTKGGRQAPKTVRYWAVLADDGPPQPLADDVDDVRWVDPASAASLLSYGRDREVLGRFLAALRAGKLEG